MAAEPRKDAECSVRILPIIPFRIWDTCHLRLPASPSRGGSHWPTAFWDSVSPSYSVWPWTLIFLPPSQKSCLYSHASSYLVYIVLSIKPKYLHMPGKWFTAELCAGNWKLESVLYSHMVANDPTLSCVLSPLCDDSEDKFILMVETPISHLKTYNWWYTAHSLCSIQSECLKWSDCKT